MTGLDPKKQQSKSMERRATMSVRPTISPGGSAPRPPPHFAPPPWRSKKAETGLTAGFSEMTNDETKNWELVFVSLFEHWSLGH